MQYSSIVCANIATLIPSKTNTIKLQQPSMTVEYFFIIKLSIILITCNINKLDACGTSNKVLSLHDLLAYKEKGYKQLLPMLSQLIYQKCLLLL
jgi:hypothetical protein